MACTFLTHYICIRNDIHFPHNKAKFQVEHNITFITDRKIERQSHKNKLKYQVKSEGKYTLSSYDSRPTSLHEIVFSDKDENSPFKTINRSKIHNRKRSHLEHRNHTFEAQDYTAVHSTKKHKIKMIYYVAKDRDCHKKYK